MTGTDRAGLRWPATGVVLGSGLVLSAVAVLWLGGWTGAVMAAGQLAAAAAVVWRPTDLGAWAAATITLILPPVAAIRHWTAGLPLACHCQRLPAAAPGLASLTGAVVLADLVLIVLAVRFARRAHRHVPASGHIRVT
ncbi:MAG: hypothetical protein M3N98_14265 [Actinomycetota bacterium]|nr:hypothetical protein [Actinomycetota bacterium]